MSKTRKKSQDAAKAPKPKPLHALAPWSCRFHEDRIDIEAYVEAAGDWQTIAEVRKTGFVDAETVANFITRAVNDYEKNRITIDELMSALELCLECDGLDWAAEHDAEIALERARTSR